MKSLFGIALPTFLIAAMMLACGSDSRSESTPEPTWETAPTFTPVPTETPPPPTQPAPVVPTVPEATPTTEILLVPTATSQPTLPPQATQGATTNDVANLRAGPGTDFAIIGSTTAGQSLTIIGRNPAGDWYQLGDGSWIAAILVVDAPPDVAVVEVPNTTAPTVATNTPSAAEVVEQPTVPPAQSANPAFTCTGGCAQPPDPSCAIKGNFNGNNGDKIYHLPDGRWYEGTDVVPEEGDVWFCTVEEAEGAGYRKAGG